MKKTVIKLVNLILALFLAVFSIGYVFAWFAGPGATVNLSLTGSAGSYFAGGNGSEKNPFIISNAQHMYNLAWLNNTGRLVPDTKYYFKVADANGNPTEIDMGNIVLPPIGTTEHPFIGDFDGNGSQIINLKVSTDHTHITNAELYNSGDKEYSTAVGMFGQTASTAKYELTEDGNSTQTIAEEEAESNVHDFILVDPQVEVSGNSSYYNSTSQIYRAGIAVGYVDGDMSNISVYDRSKNAAMPNTKLKVSSIGNNHFATLNSIIGGAAEDVNDDDIVGEDTSGENISIFLPPNDTNNRNLEYAAIMTSLNGYTSSQARWTSDINKADITSSRNDGLGFGNFFLTFLRLQTDGDSSGMHFRSSQSINSFDLNYYGYDGTSKEWKILDTGFDASTGNSYGELVRDKSNEVYSATLRASLRFRSAAQKLGSDTLLYLENESRIVGAVNDTDGGDTVITGSAYANLYLNAFLVNITENDGSIFIVGSQSGGGTLTLKKLLTANEVTAALRLKAVQALYSSDTAKYSAFADYITTTNIFNSDGSRNETLYNLLINTQIDTLTNINTEYFFAKNDYDILENVNFDNGTVILSEFTLGAGRDDQGIYFNLSQNDSTLSYVDNQTETPGTVSITVAGNSNAGPGLYVLYANTGTNNLDINYFKATGVSNGDAGNQSSSAMATKILRRVDFIYDLALPIGETMYVHTNAIVTFATSTSGATIILGFNRYVTNTDGVHILNVYYSDERNGDTAVYTVTISQIPGTTSPYFNSATYNSGIGFPEW